MADVKASLDELRYYCANAFKVDLTKVLGKRAR